jgi:hypothetical protein
MIIVLKKASPSTKKAVKKRASGTRAASACAKASRAKTKASGAKTKAGMAAKPAKSARKAGCTKAKVAKKSSDASITEWTPTSYSLSQIKFQCGPGSGSLALLRNYREKNPVRILIKMGIVDNAVWYRYDGFYAVQEVRTVGSDGKKFFFTLCRKPCDALGLNNVSTDTMRAAYKRERNNRRTAWYSEWWKLNGNPARFDLSIVAGKPKARKRKSSHA